mgnify:FL=1
MSDEYIVFADENVKAICLQYWDTNGDSELSYAEAAAVTDLGWAFKDNGTISTFDELQYFTSLTTISNYAFRCSSLSSTTIPSSVTSIGDFAFYECNNLTSITIPNGVTLIGGSAFSYCANLTNVVLPSTLYEIGYGGFGSCSSLSSVCVCADTPPALGD